MKNQLGLDRPIPEPVKRTVRQECGFGCVKCGMPIVQYHHINPYSQVIEHDPTQIALLCPTHHAQVTSGTISNDQVRDWRAKPFARGTGRCEGADIFYLTHPLELRIGSNTFHDFSCVVRNRHGDEWLGIEKADDGSGMVHLNAKFYNSDGSRSLRIAKNLWDCEIEGLWDIKSKGATFSIWREHRQETLRLRAIPPHTLMLERLEMRVGERGITVARDGTTTIHMPSGSVSMQGISATGGDSIYYID